MNPKQARDIAAHALEPDPHFPNSRYFQIHFEHLYGLIDELKHQLITANQQIAQLQRLQSGDLQAAKQASPRTAIPHKMLSSQTTRAKRRP